MSTLNVLRVLIPVSLLLTACGGAISSTTPAYLMWEPDAAAELFVKGCVSYTGMTEDECSVYYFTHNVKYEKRTAGELGLANVWVIPMSQISNPELALPLAETVPAVAAAVPLTEFGTGLVISGLYLMSPAYQEKMARIEGARQLQPEDILLVTAVMPVIMVPMDPTLTLPEFYPDIDLDAAWGTLTTARIMPTGATRREKYTTDEGYNVELLWTSTEASCIGEAHTVFLFLNEQNRWDVQHILKNFTHPGPCQPQDFVDAIKEIAREAQSFWRKIMKTAPEGTWERIWKPFIENMARIADFVGKNID